MADIQFGQFGLTVLMTVFLGIAFKFADALEDRAKVLIALGLGIVLGLAGIPYNGLPWTFVNVFNHVITGILTGAAASGFYKWQDITIKGG